MHPQLKTKLTGGAEDLRGCRHVEDMRLAEYVAIFCQFQLCHLRKHLAYDELSISITICLVFIGYFMCAQKSRHTLQIANFTESPNDSQHFELMLERQAVTGLRLDSGGAGAQE